MVLQIIIGVLFLTGMIIWCSAFTSTAIRIPRLLFSIFWIYVINTIFHCGLVSLEKIRIPGLLRRLLCVRKMVLVGLGGRIKRWASISLMKVRSRRAIDGYWIIGLERVRSPRKKKQ